MESDGHGYCISPSNQLLYFFFKDSKIVEKYHVWRPIGETAITELDRLGRKPADDPYNLESDRDFDDFVRWESPIYVSLLLFDIMVTQALKQNINWHMWLYYLTYITKNIIRNHKTLSPNLESNDTYRSRYDAILVLIFSQLIEWVRAVEWLPKDQSNIILRRVSADTETGNIPKSSIIALGDCLKYLLIAENIGDRFKRNLSQSIFNLYFDLKEHGFDDFAEALLLTIKANRVLSYNREPRYIEYLREAFETFDKVPRRGGHINHLRQTLFGNC